VTACAPANDVRDAFCFACIQLRINAFGKNNWQQSHCVNVQAALGFGMTISFEQFKSIILSGSKDSNTFSRCVPVAVARCVWAMRVLLEPQKCGKHIVTVSLVAFILGGSWRLRL
jgi:hypothetical protein